VDEKQVLEKQLLEKKVVEKKVSSWQISITIRPLITFVASIAAT
jgi:hypothetical protein